MCSPDASPVKSVTRSCRNSFLSEGMTRHHQCCFVAQLYSSALARPVHQRRHVPEEMGAWHCGIKPACRNSATRPSPLERVSSDEPGAPMRNCTTALQNSIGGAWSYPQIRTSCGKSGSHF